MKKNNIEVNNVVIKTLSLNGFDYISITDIAKQKNPTEPKDVVKNWMRLKNTLEYLGLWEKLNNQNFNGSSKWRLPTVSELAALRHCSSGWKYVSDAVIPTGRTVLSEDNDGISPELRARYLAAGISVAATPTRREVPETISVRHRCNLSSSWEQIKFYSAFDALSPIEPKYYDSQWDVSVPYWAWTSNFDVSNYRDSIWIVNPIFGGLRIIKPNENSMSFSNAVYVFLVRDN